MVPWRPAGYLCVRRRFAPTNGARVVELQVRGASTVEPSFERHPFRATSSSRTRGPAAPHRRNNSGGSRPGDGSAPGGMTLDSRPVMRLARSCQCCATRYTSAS